MSRLSVNMRPLTMGPDPVYLVSQTEAALLERDEGFTSLAPYEACQLLGARARYDMSSLRYTLPDIPGLAPGMLRQVSNQKLLPRLEQALLRGDLVAVRAGGELLRGANASDERQILLTQLRRELGSSVIRFEGSSLELVLGWERRQARAAGDAVVVRPQQAATILARYQTAPGTSPRVAPLIERAIPLLAPAWNLFEEPDGLVLLRYEMRRADSSRPDEPAITPSAMRAAAADKNTEWIEFVFENADGTPFEGAIELELPDGRKETRTIGANGKMRESGIPAGQVMMSLKSIDEQAWK